MIFNGRVTGLLATLRSDNRSGALKGKQRIGQKQSSMAKHLQGLAFFLLELKIYYFYWSYVNNKLCMQIKGISLADATDAFPAFCMPDCVMDALPDTRDNDTSNMNPQHRFRRSV